MGDPSRRRSAGHLCVLVAFLSDLSIGQGTRRVLVRSSRGLFRRWEVLNLRLSSSRSHDAAAVPSSGVVAAIDYPVDRPARPGARPGRGVERRVFYTSFLSHSAHCAIRGRRVLARSRAFLVLRGPPRHRADTVAGQTSRRWREAPEIRFPHRRRSRSSPFLPLTARSAP